MWFVSVVNIMIYTTEEHDIFSSEILKTNVVKQKISESLHHPRLFISFSLGLKLLFSVTWRFSHPFIFIIDLNCFHNSNIKNIGPICYYVMDLEFKSLATTLYFIPLLLYHYNNILHPLRVKTYRGYPYMGSYGMLFW